MIAFAPPRTPPRRTGLPPRYNPPVLRRPLATLSLHANALTTVPLFTGPSSVILRRYPRALYFDAPYYQYRTNTFGHSFDLHLVWFLVPPAAYAGFYPTATPRPSRIVRWISTLFAAYVCALAILCAAVETGPPLLSPRLAPATAYAAATLLRHAPRAGEHLRQWRQRRRAAAFAAHRCPDCGYDLRATPHRCPECGAQPLMLH